MNLSMTRTQFTILKRYEHEIRTYLGTRYEEIRREGKKLSKSTEKVLELHANGITEL